MFILRFLHFWMGYVVFSASGGFPERFVNLCAGMHIPVWDIRPHGGVLYGKTRIGTYLALRKAARKSGMRLRIVQKKGVPFFMYRYRKRVGLLIGAAVFGILLCVLSARVWVIDISGNDAVSEQTICAALSRIGIREGIRPDSFDASQAERRLLPELEGVSWIALNVDGSVLHVEVRERLETGEAQDYTHPCHIVAAKDGYLCTLETYEGKPIARLRTAVQKGQLLISGVKEHKDGTVTLHHAQGYAEAETMQTVTAQKETSPTYETVSDADFRIALRLFGITVPLGKAGAAKGAQYFTYEKRMTAKGLYLPVSCIVYRNTYYNGTRTLTDRQTQLLLQSDFQTKAAEQLRGSRILSAQVTYADTATGEYRLLENIGTEQPIETEEPSETTAAFLRKR